MASLNFEPEHLPAFRDASETIPDDFDLTGVELLIDGRGMEHTWQTMRQGNLE